MMTYLKKNPIKFTIVVSLLGMVLYLFLTADPPGYCSEQKRFLSDEEFIEIAVRDEIKKMNIDGSEESIRSFHAKHPDCCRVSRGGNKPMGVSANDVIVRLVFEANERWSSATKTKFYEDNLIIDPCGSVLDSYGEGIKSLPAGY